MANYCMNDIVLYSKRKKPLIRPHNQLKHLSKEDSYSYPIHRLLSSLDASYLVDDLDDLRHYILDFDSIDKKTTPITSTSIQKLLGLLISKI